jgi:hypothetical protein
MVSVMACACLTGCGDSKELLRLKDDVAEIERNLEDRRVELQSATNLLSGQTSECNTSRTETAARIAELRDTILNILDGVQVADGDDISAAGHSWTIAVQDLSPESWNWRVEEMGVIADSGGNVTGAEENLIYSVDPRRLSAKVKVGDYRGYPAIQIICDAAAACINVRGRRAVGSGNTWQGTRDTSNSDVSETRQSNWWAVSSPADSGRLAVATGELITLQRSSISPACQSAEDGKAKVSALETEIANLEKNLAEKQRDLRLLDN